VDAGAGTWRVAVLREGAGRGASAYVHDRVAVGDSIAVRGPRNHFRLEEAPGYLFIAGGIGITPLLGMVQECHVKGLPWQLHYGGRRRGQMAFVDHLGEVYPDNVRTYPRDSADRMDIPSIVSGLPAGHLIYCCGPTALVNAVQEAGSGLPSETVHIEHFVPVASPDGAEDQEFEVELTEEGVTVRIPADRSILEVAEEAGAFVVSSCLEGTCGSCETRVLSGTPHHRDSVLTESQKASNQTMMICVSRARSSKLVLDL
jgi:ferredoxin-NADP reductase